MKEKTINDLRDTQADMQKQLDKASEKYHTLLRRSTAIGYAIEQLECKTD